MRFKTFSKVIVAGTFLFSGMSMAEVADVDDQNKKELEVSKNVQFGVVEKMTSPGLEKLFLQAKETYNSELAGNCTEGKDYNLRIKAVSRDMSEFQGELSAVMSALYRIVNPNANNMSTKVGDIFSNFSSDSSWTNSEITKRILTGKYANFSKINSSVEALAKDIVSAKESAGSRGNWTVLAGQIPYTYLLKGNDVVRVRDVTLELINDKNIMLREDKLNVLIIADNNNKELFIVANGSCETRALGSGNRKGYLEFADANRGIDRKKENVNLKSLVLQNESTASDKFSLQLNWSLDEKYEDNGPVVFQEEDYNISHRAGPTVFARSENTEENVSLLAINSIHFVHLGAKSEGAQKDRCTKTFDVKEPWFAKKYVGCDEKYNSSVTVYNLKDGVTEQTVMDGFRRAGHILDNVSDDVLRRWLVDLFNNEDYKEFAQKYMKDSTTYCLMAEAKPNTCE